MAAYKKHFDDSVAMIKASAEKAVALQNSVPLDSTKVTGVKNIDTVKEEFTYIENDLVKVKFDRPGQTYAHNADGSR